jgi:hypothetical protein
MNPGGVPIPTCPLAVPEQSSSDSGKGAGQAGRDYCPPRQGRHRPAAGGAASGGPCPPGAPPPCQTLARSCPPLLGRERAAARAEGLRPAPHHALLKVWRRQQHACAHRQLLRLVSTTITTSSSCPAGGPAAPAARHTCIAGCALLLYARRAAIIAGALLLHPCCAAIDAGRPCRLHASHFPGPASRPAARLCIPQLVPAACCCCCRRCRC